MYYVNNNVDLMVFPLDSIGKTANLTPNIASFIKQLLMRLKVFDDYLTIGHVSYYSNKRGFVVNTSDRKRWFIKPIIKKEVSLVYLGRLLLGQPKCCANAHTLGTNLPAVSTNPDKYKIYEQANLVPCSDCFNNLQSHEYLNTVWTNKHPYFSNVSSENINQINYTTLAFLLENDDCELEIDEEVNKAFYSRSIESTIRGLNTVCKEGQLILDKCADVFSPIDVAILQQVENLVTTSVNVAIIVASTPIEAMTHNTCYEFSETMAQLRSNLNNMSFTLKYKGVMDGNAG